MEVRRVLEVGVVDVTLLEVGAKLSAFVVEFDIISGVFTVFVHSFSLDSDTADGIIDMC